MKRYNKCYGVQLLEGRNWINVGPGWETEKDARSAMYGMVLIKGKGRVVEFFSACRPIGKVVDFRKR